MRYRVINNSINTLKSLEIRTHSHNGMPIVWSYSKKKKRAILITILMMVTTPPPPLEANIANSHTDLVGPTKTR